MFFSSLHKPEQLAQLGIMGRAEVQYTDSDVVSLHHSYVMDTNVRTEFRFSDAGSLYVNLEETCDAETDEITLA